MTFQKFLKSQFPFYPRERHALGRSKFRRNRNTAVQIDEQEMEGTIDNDGKGRTNILLCRHTTSQYPDMPGPTCRLRCRIEVALGSLNELSLESIGEPENL